MAPRARLWDRTHILYAFRDAGDSLEECVQRPFCKIEDFRMHLAQAADDLERCQAFYADLVPDGVKLVSRLLVELEGELGLCRPEMQEDLPEGYSPSCEIIVGLCWSVNEQILQAVVGSKGGHRIGADTVEPTDHLIKQKNPQLKCLGRYCDVVRFVGTQFLHTPFADDRSLRSKLQSKEVQPTACIIAVRYLIAAVRLMGRLVVERQGQKQKDMMVNIVTKAEGRVRGRKEAAALNATRNYVRTMIRQRNLQQLWLDHLSQQEEVAWDEWWRVFPAKLTGLPPDQQLWLQDWLSSGDQRHRTAFKAALGLDNADTISAAALGKAFSDIERRQQSDDDEMTASLIDVIRHMTSCLLPRLDARYYQEARQQEATHVCELLTQKQCTAVVLVGESGLGKTQLSLDIGWRLFTDKRLPGGAAMVRLQGASTPAQVLSEFCTALGLELCAAAAVTPEAAAHPESRTLLTPISFDPGRKGVAAHQEGLDGVVRHLTAVPGEGTQLLVLDSAQDSLYLPDFRKLVAQITARAPAIRLLITSRTKWPEDVPEGEQLVKVAHVDVARISNDHLKTIKSKANVLLAEDDVNVVLDVIGGSPLKWHLLLDALASGRLSIERLRIVMKAQGVLGVVLHSLRASHQLALAQLSVFPYGFTATDATAVLTRCTEGQAAALLSRLYEQGLLEYDSALGQHYLHQDMRHAAALQPEKEMPGIIQAAQEAFARLLIAHMHDYADAQLTPREQQVAVLRAAQRDMQNWQELQRLQQDHPELMDANMSKQEAINLSNTALLIFDCGKQFAAEPILRVCVTWSQRALGEEHPDTLTTLHNLAICLGRQGATSPTKANTTLTPVQQTSRPASAAARSSQSSDRVLRSHPLTPKETEHLATAVKRCGQACLPDLLKCIYGGPLAKDRDKLTSSHDRCWIYMYRYRKSTTGRFKVGKTCSPAVGVRMKEWEKQCGHAIEVVHDREVLFEGVAEKLIHTELKGRGMWAGLLPCRRADNTTGCGQKHKEWFEGAADKIIEVIDYWVDYVNANRWLTHSGEIVSYQRATD